MLCRAAKGYLHACHTLLRGSTHRPPSIFSQGQPNFCFPLIISILDSHGQCLSPSRKTDQRILQFLSPSKRSCQTRLHDGYLIPNNIHASVLNSAALRLKMGETEKEISSDWLCTLPSARFEAQVQHELLRLHQQPLQPPRKQVLPSNPQWSPITNSVANVRLRWQRQGIWRRDWASDPCTPSRSEFMEPLDAWPHELSDEPYSSASRPYQQFNFEVMLEVDWIMANTESSVDLNVLDKVALEEAVERVRRRWMEGGIWSPFWATTPGAEWMHEVYFARREPLFSKHDPESAASRKQHVQGGAGTNQPSASRPIVQQRIPGVEKRDNRFMRSSKNKESRHPDESACERTVISDTEDQQDASPSANEDHTTESRGSSLRQLDERDHSLQVEPVRLSTKPNFPREQGRFAPARGATDEQPANAPAQCHSRHGSRTPTKRHPLRGQPTTNQIECWHAVGLGINLNIE